MQQVIEHYKKQYTNECTVIKSPLRICPLGAHIDHQHGFVSGMALDSSIYMAYSKNDSGYIRIQSIDFPDEETFHIDSVPLMIPGYWGNYLRGAVLSLSRDFKLKYGIEGYISGKLPIGGLSSSAAVITAYLMALCEANKINLSKEQLIHYSHWVETDFIGLHNGILDQASNILSQNDYLMYMDCKTEAYKLIKKSNTLPEFEVVVVYSGISTALIGTDYNNRVDECKVAAWILQELSGNKIKSFKEVRLRDVAYTDYLKYKEQLPDMFRRRADHYFGECDRVQKGIDYWSSGNIEEFGQLMFQSGNSSVGNYECGCSELITIFEILKSCEGVYGARFSGAGYRGCCIGIINPEYKDTIKEKLDTLYPIQYPQHKDTYNVYFCKTDDGAKIIKL